VQDLSRARRVFVLVDASFDYLLPPVRVVLEGGMSFSLVLSIGEIYDVIEPVALPKYQA